MKYLPGYTWRGVHGNFNMEVKIYPVICYVPGIVEIADAFQIRR